MSRMTFKGGTHPNDQKQFARDNAFVHYLPKGEMVFPINQHIGKSANPIVKKGDAVLAGQVIAEADGFVSSNIISSCSGTVKEVELRQTAAGTMAMSIVIDNDGKYNQVDGIGKETDYSKLSGSEIISKVKAAGIVGLGGAGFPTHVKLSPKNPAGIHHILANGAECEPFITCDDRLMREYSDDIVKGMEILLTLFPTAEGDIVIEKNKPEAIEAMKKACAASPMSDKIKVYPVKTKYPQGGERSIISVVTGNHYKSTQLPADAGCIVDNVSTIRAIYRAVAFNEPLMEKGFTISGDCLKQPTNFFTRIGVSYQELFDECGGCAEGKEAAKLISGGPMMGMAMANLEVPVQKAHNALTVLGVDEVASVPTTACLRCGRCNAACPLGLIPQYMADAAVRKDLARYENDLYGLECIACGSCTYVCPAKRPLVQYFKTAKAEILLERKKQQEAK
ncbi:MAG: electron transport complex subunit RsxC [Lachnospiraceae bacterium]|nr:electron transport complex subunit RsxC [Lachnospiraceae bacterium]